jgi:hypothetical protein
MITMPVTFFAAVQCPHARSRAVVPAGVMPASRGMAAARSGSARPASAAIRAGVEGDQPAVSSVAGVKDRARLIAVSDSRRATRRLLANARRVRKEPIVSRGISRTGTGSRRGGSSGAVTAPAGGLAEGAGGLGGVVQADAVQGFPGDLLGAVHDGLDGGAADEVGQAADHPVGPLVQVGVQSLEVAGLVAVQPQRLLERGDQRLPLLALCCVPVGEGVAGDHAEPPGDLLAAGPGEQATALDVDARVDEGGRDALGQVLQLVGRVGAGAGGEVQVVDLVDFTDRFNPDLPSDLR